jgi:Putative restriction endonuclease
MSTVDRPQPRVLPALEAGQRLDQPTFHERYAAMPSETRAELVGGVVYMPSPLRTEHGGMDHQLALWVMHYRRFTPGLQSGANVTNQLGEDGETQPDSYLRIPEELGGNSRVVDGYVTGPAELIVEIGKSSRSYDLGPKKDEYEKAGVLEYLFVGIEPDEIRWFVRRQGKFEEMAAGADGIYRSEVFPGLWLDPKALFEEDLNALIAALEQGLATREHGEFVDRLAARRAGA